MIVVKLMGGLGNQMFQYAFARHIQVQTGQRIIFITTGFLKDTSGRVYALEHFKLKDATVPGFLKQWYYTVILKMKVMIFTKCDKKKGFGEHNYHELTERGLYYTNDMFDYYREKLTSRKNRYIFGFFQSEKYFADIESSLRKEFKCKETYSKKYMEMQKKILECNSVCLHIRRGDYIGADWSTLVHVCNDEYYIKAMDEVAHKVKLPKFFVFSNNHDDLEWIRINFKFQYEVTYVDLNNSDYKELMLMSKCNHFILSNSSFSWWASYLSTNKEQVVVAPDRWHKEFEAHDIYRSHWIKMNVE